MQMASVVGLQPSPARPPQGLFRPLPLPESRRPLFSQGLELLHTMETHAGQVPQLRGCGLQQVTWKSL